MSSGDRGEKGSSASRFWRRFRQKTSSFCSCSGRTSSERRDANGEVIQDTTTTTNDESSNNSDGGGSFVEVDMLRYDLNAGRKYPDNSIRTAKYTWLSCFPLSLFYQFYRVSNVYFLIVMVITLIPGASPVNPLSSLIPFCIVLGAGISKDLWEDGKRRESDRRANNVKAYVLRGNEFEAVASRDVRVGDVMLCKLGEEVRADVLLLNSSHAGGVTYIETANLDGETNAKTRRAKPQTIEALGTVEDIIDHCLPSAKMKAHFLKHGTMEKWNGTERVVATTSPTKMPDSPDVGSRLKLSDSLVDTGPLTPLRLENYKPPEHGLPQFVRPPIPGIDTPGVEANKDNMDPCIHPRSRTFLTPDAKYLDGQNKHRRGLTFDERFMVGREVPVPSDILAMSRRYEERLMGQSVRATDTEGIGRDGKRKISGEGSPNKSVTPTKSTKHNVLSKNNQGKTLDSSGFGKSVNMTENVEVNTTTNGVVILGAPPCPELYSWIGQLRMGDGELIPLGIEQLLPRGCVIRNTEWVLCVVLYTGKNTKMLLNLQPKPTKMSLVARRLNYINLFFFILQQVMLFIICGLAVVWRNSHLTPPEGTRSGYSVWYIQWFLSRYSPNSLFGLRYLTNFVLMSFLIPLSLYVSLEFNKAIQMILIARDRRMASFDEFSGELRFPRPKTSELNSQLALVRYIFTDKTGTLTQNCMTYVGGCTATEKHDERERPGALGEAFLQLVGQQHRESAGMATKGPGVALTSSSGEKRVLRPHRSTSPFDFDEKKMESEPLFQYLRALSLCHSVVCFDRQTVDDAAAASQSVRNSPYPPLALETSVNSMRVSINADAREMNVHERWASHNLGQSLSVLHASTASGVGRFLRGHTGSASWYVTRHNDMHEHERTATMPRIVLEMKDKSKIYEGQSLDEIALVTAARDNLFALQKRNATHMYIQAANKMMCYEIIAELEFTPQRKLMSILLCRCPLLDDAADADGAEKVENSYHRQKEKPVQEVRRQSPPPPREMVLNVLGSQRGFPVNTENGSDEEDEDERRRSRNTTKIFTGEPEGLDEDDEEESPYLLLVKGADNSMLEIVNNSNPRNAELKPVFQRELEAMAREGLRTLVLGQRYITEREVLEWLPIFNEAQCSMQNRSEKLHSAYALMEKEIDLIGTTAVEDELQEGVPETLKFFLQAEIVVWMLTGDKRETAVTIAGTSGLVDSAYENSVVHLDVADISMNFDSCEAAAADPTVQSTLKEQMDAAVLACEEADAIHKGERVIVLVVDGRTLDVIFGDKTITSDFFKLGTRCRSAVCCRMTPLQKAKVVRLFQKNTRHTALAIGDGANDVSMIQESRIGVGIMGLEGSQAELASDYAIPAFRFLKRLLVVHGRFSLYRDAHCILFSLYKNVVLCVGLTFYAFHCGYSGMILMESWLLALFNLLFCAVQPLMIGIFDKDVSDELAESIPALYPPLAREEMFFHTRYIAKWFIDGLVDGFALILVLMYVVGVWDTLYPYRSPALEDYGMMYFIMMLLIVNLRVAGLTTCYNVILFGVIAYGFIVIPLLTLAYSAIPDLLGSNWCVYIAMELMSDPKFWLLLLFTAGVFLVYGVAVNAYIAMFWPWMNGGPAMRAAWNSPYRKEHHERILRLRRRAAAAAAARTASSTPP
ncbi:phospholipid transporting ATPase-like protein [Trypanosoma theileri]|uniref:Phospholipid-transporting ATPase n=1 Tax=Trypanosoma theileri TaxID=67003 RepID=A0A1X0NP72_9TRYP|nr:phospholipid transporting ATPase-like protein [Trypanosoma theileri]ORC85930.1 phospholipid transporting ATPase-like protein [Trypanosoma theileri]